MQKGILFQCPCVAIYLLRKNIRRMIQGLDEELWKDIEEGLIVAGRVFLGGGHKKVLT